MRTDRITPVGEALLLFTSGLAAAYAGTALTATLPFMVLALFLISASSAMVVHSTVQLAKSYMARGECCNPFGWIGKAAAVVAVLAVGMFMLAFGVKMVAAG